MRSFLATLFLSLLCPTATPAADRLVVFAAASLRNAFTDIATRFENDTGTRVILNFAGSQNLAAQLLHGASADVFASADEQHMKSLVDAGLVDSKQTRAFARNSLAAIWTRKRTPPGGLSDLAASGVKLVVADPAVPAGHYTRQLLDRMERDPAFGPEFRRGFEHNVVSLENNVRMVLAKVALGEADGGIVYNSDLSSDEGVRVVAMPIPETLQITASYPIAPLRRSNLPDLAAAFIEAVFSEAGRKVLARDGFLVD